MEKSRNIHGISAIICCYNSAKKLPKTLEYLKKQKVPLSVPWEVLLVDNCSSDDTIIVGKKIWDDNPPSPLRIAKESKPGLSYARNRGLKESTYEYLCFIDDDNWINENYLFGIYRIFEGHQDVAACGGAIVENCETEPPIWFDKFKGNYTVWKPCETAGFMDQPLCGAGMSIRKSAWNYLRWKGFSSQLIDRQGSKLSSGGDFELSYAFLIGGWKLYFDPSLQVRHFIPSERLNWDYLKRLNEGFGSQSAYLDAYTIYLENSEGKKKSSQKWVGEGIFCLKTVLSNIHWLVFEYLGKGEGSSGVLLLFGQWGRLKTLIHLRHRYNKGIIEFKNKNWINSYRTYLKIADE